MVIAVVVGALVGKRSYIVVSALEALLPCIPFFVTFERQRISARSLALLAAMIALAVAARAVFAFVPFFKPMVAIIMITGMALGPSSGFLAGSVAALASNFIFGQGPWTPFQMLAFGLCGFLFGVAAERSSARNPPWSPKTRLVVSLGGALCVILIAGPILDTSTLFWLMGSLTPESALAVYLGGLPVNAIHGVATFITLFLGGSPILSMVARLRMKYGF